MISTLYSPAGKWRVGCSNVLYTSIPSTSIVPIKPQGSTNLTINIYFHDFKILKVIFGEMNPPKTILTENDFDQMTGFVRE